MVKALPSHNTKLNAHIDFSDHNSWENQMMKRGPRKEEPQKPSLLHVYNYKPETIKISNLLNYINNSKMGTWKKVQKMRNKEKELKFPGKISINPNSKKRFFLQKIQIYHRPMIFHEEI